MWDMKKGVIKTEERQMIYNVFDFDDSRAEDIMVPRIDVTFADINSSYEDLVPAVPGGEAYPLPGIS